MSGGRVLGAAALALGVAAPFAGAAPERGEAAARIDVAALARMVAAQQDHVSALDLARWIRGRRPGLRVVDVRAADAFAGFAIPTAENIPIARIPDARFRDDEIVVLYSEGGAHAAQAWVFLKAAGVRNAYFIAGGLGDWFDEVLSPAVPAAPPPAEAAHYAEVAALSAYFGGTPRTGAAAGAAVHGDDTARLVDAARRRGC